MHCFDKTFEREQGKEEFKRDASHPFSPSELQRSEPADGQIVFALLEAGVQRDVGVSQQKVKICRVTLGRSGRFRSRALSCKVCLLLASS